MGIRVIRREVMAVGNGGRGKVDEDQGSSGPVTKTKWDESKRGK